MEKLFNEIKGKQNETNLLLEEKQKTIAELRPLVVRFEQENKKLAR